MERLTAERRVGADVDRGDERAVRHVSLPGVHALRRQQDPGRNREVGGGKPHIPAPSRALDDSAVDRVPASQRQGGPVEIPGGQRLTDGGRRYGPPLQLQHADALDGEPVRRTQLSEDREVPRGLVAEREVGSNDGASRVQSFDQHARHELLCGPARELLGELEDQKCVDPQPFDELGLAV